MTHLTLGFPSFYFKDYDEATAFYTAVFGPPPTDLPAIKGWKFGDTWLTFFPSSGGSHPEGNPKGCEFAIEVDSKEEVDELYAKLLKAGAKKCMEPEDTEMYDPMRFCCVDDPFGVRIDVYFRL
jgi:catechol 2,3-dioxygenase-like lactoylglutathione lyase family enzyme